MSSRPAGSTQQVSGQPGLHSKILSHKTEGEGGGRRLRREGRGDSQRIHLRELLKPRAVGHMSTVPAADSTT